MIDIRQLQGNLEHLNLGHVKTSFSRRKQAVALTRAAEYEHGVRTKVQTSRNDPRPAVADDEWQRIRAAKLAERQAVQEA